MLLTCSQCRRQFDTARPKRRFCSPECYRTWRRVEYGPAHRKPIQERFWEHVIKRDGCWGWTGTRNEHGYPHIGSGPRPCKPIKAHRLSWEIHHGPIPSELWVLHKCDNPECVNPEHLFLGTQQDNVDDMMRKGRYGDRSHAHRAMRGETGGRARLTNEQAREALRRHREGEAQSAIAKSYGVHLSTIHLLVKGRSWKWLHAEARG